MLVIIDADVVTRKSSVAIGICKKSYKIRIFVLKHQQNSKINEPVSKKCIYDFFHDFFICCYEIEFLYWDENRLHWKPLWSPLNNRQEFILFFSWNKIGKTWDEHVIKPANCQNCGAVLWVVKGMLSYHLCVKCFSQLSFDSEVYTKSATAPSFQIPRPKNFGLGIWKLGNLS